MHHNLYSVNVLVTGHNDYLVEHRKILVFPPLLVHKHLFPFICLWSECKRSIMSIHLCCHLFVGSRNTPLKAHSSICKFSGTYLETAALCCPPLTICFRDSSIRCWTACAFSSSIQAFAKPPQNPKRDLLLLEVFPYSVDSCSTASITELSGRVSLRCTSHKFTPLRFSGICARSYPISPLLDSCNARWCFLQRPCRYLSLHKSSRNAENFTGYSYTCLETRITDLIDVCRKTRSHITLATWQKISHIPAAFAVDINAIHVINSDSNRLPNLPTWMIRVESTKLSHFPLSLFNRRSISRHEHLWTDVNLQAGVAHRLGRACTLETCTQEWRKEPPQNSFGVSTDFCFGETIRKVCFRRTEAAIINQH